MMTSVKADPRYIDIMSHLIDHSVKFKDAVAVLKATSVNPHIRFTIKDYTLDTEIDGDIRAYLRGWDMPIIEIEENNEEIWVHIGATGEVYHALNVPVNYYSCGDTTPEQ